ncbi:TetR-like C-terminal domain-containing protein [Streptomyces sp. NPDC102274]|uniref:TetR-like C-terminal domain-containing protein n=1 Tax=Streptomyces sp. NPDC102274 TaxID=3366151 RepID=UPI00381E12F7
MDDIGDDAEERLHAACIACLDFADAHPERYRDMFGDLANPPVTGGGTVGQDLAPLGADALRIRSDTLTEYVTAGYSTSTDPCADTIARWLGLHGLAHQRATAHDFPWPADRVRPSWPRCHALARPLARPFPNLCARPRDITHKFTTVGLL